MALRLQPPARRALWVALGYFAFGVTWVLVGDAILMASCETLGPDGVGLIASIKGTVFVFLSAGLLFFTLRWTFSRIESESAALATNEQRYRGLVETQRDIVVRHDPQGRFTFVNDTACRVLGHPREALLGAAWQDFVHPDDIAASQAAEAMAYQAPAYRATVENRILAADGPRWYGWDGYVIFDDKGGILEVQVVGRDVTDAHRREEELREARIAAESASQAKTRFLATMSHELRTPLTAILGFVDLVRTLTFGPVGNPAYLDHAEDANQAGEHLLHLINDILDMSRIESGRLTLEPTRLPTADVLQTAMRSARLHRRSSAIVSVTCPPGVPDLWVDERRVHHILVNLLSNALKFTPDTGTVDIQAKAGARADTVEIVISDTGCGMSPELISQALEPFEQLSHHLTRRYEGSGLGLSLALGLTRLLGGNLNITSAMGQGTVVTVTLPTAAN